MVHHFRFHCNCVKFLLNPLSVTHPGGGVTTIYAGTGCAIFGVPFFKQQINFGVSFLVKSQLVINFGVSF